MRELARLKTTTPSGKIFLSPFVFFKKEALRRIEEPKLQEPETVIHEDGKIQILKNVTEMIPTRFYPSAAVWTERKFGSEVIRIETLIEKIALAQRAWEVMELAYNRKNA